MCTADIKENETAAAKLGMSVIRGTFLQNMRTLKARNMRKNMWQNMHNITKICALKYAELRNYKIYALKICGNAEYRKKYAR